MAIEATGGDYIPEIDRLINALEAQRVTYGNAEDVRASEWQAIMDEVINARGRADSAIAAMASAGVVFATHAEIDEAFESIIAPAIGTDTVLDGLTQEDYDYAFGKVFGQ